MVNTKLALTDRRYEARDEAGRLISQNGHLFKDERTGSIIWPFLILRVPIPTFCAADGWSDGAVELTGRTGL